MIKLIKFRAWNKEEGDFEYMDFTKGGEIWCNDEWLPLQQYTGCDDKNGKEIYVGDRVIKQGKETDTHTGMGVMEITDSPRSWVALEDAIIDGEPLEIVGNINEGYAK